MCRQILEQIQLNSNNFYNKQTKNVFSFFLNISCIGTLWMGKIYFYEISEEWKEKQVARRRRKKAFFFNRVKCVLQFCSFPSRLLMSLYVVQDWLHERPKMK